MIATAHVMVSETNLWIIVSQFNERINATQIPHKSVSIERMSAT